MFTGRTIVAQLMDLLPLHEFRKCVRYRSERKVLSFSYLDQFLCLRLYATDRSLSFTGHASG
ncbi:MAG: DUF4372 domain-containing protein [Terriglobia bacterium]